MVGILPQAQDKAAAGDISRHEHYSIMVVNPDDRTEEITDGVAETSGPEGD
jgi:hypothetical protein